jgi:hypothetical protein
MPRYLAEAYLSGAHEDAGRRARAAARELSLEGTPVRWLRLTFLPDDETCFHVFEAGSADAVEEASRRAGLGPVRVSLAVE